MKKWTVMLIPHDRGSSHTLNVSFLPVLLLAGLILLLSFSSAFFFRRSSALEAETERLRAENQALENTERTEPAKTGLADEERAELERSIRAEYEQCNAAVAAKLAELYDIEAQVREIHGLPPRAASTDGGVGGGSGGQGGLPGGISDVAGELSEDAIDPPELIYGLARPSADLILQEIALRKDSLEALLTAMEAQRDRVERMPSIWPVDEDSRRITSSFGYRKDPFTRKTAFHSGLDIGAPYGSPIMATAKGVVIYSGYDRYLGNTVKLDHGGGFQTWYAHLRKRNVKAGDEVERCDVIGTLGNTGRSTGAHLHYEVRVNKKPVNPRRYLGD